MDWQKINGICIKAPVILSWTAFVWVLGNVAAGGAHALHRPPNLFRFFTAALRCAGVRVISDTHSASATICGVTSPSSAFAANAR